MPGSAELDQVADVRRKLATHALGNFPELSRTDWMVGGGAWVVGLGVQERRHGVRLPHRMSAYPSARKAQYAFIAIFAVSFSVIDLLVGFGHRVIASVLLVPAAVALVVCQKVTRAKIREDIEAGRVSVGL